MYLRERFNWMISERNTANCRISKVDINQYVALWHPCAYHHFNTSFSQTCDWVRRNMFIDAMSESAVSD
jgi:hypothetical protein